MVNSADPVSENNWSGSTLFAKAGGGGGGGRGGYLGSAEQGLTLNIRTP